MMKWLPLISVFLMAGFIVSSCATASPDDYLSANCKDLRNLVKAQDFAASIRGVEFESDRNLEELNHASGSPWAGKPRTHNEKKLRDERQAIREAYRRKGCKA